MFDPYAVALDFRVMARDAHMRVPEIGLGTRINLALTSVARATIIDL
jgi:enoyl-CoA hydratase